MLVAGVGQEIGVTACVVASEAVSGGAGAGQTNQRAHRAHRAIRHRAYSLTGTNTPAIVQIASSTSRASNAIIGQHTSRAIDRTPLAYIGAGVCVADAGGAVEQALELVVIVAALA